MSKIIKETEEQKKIVDYNGNNILVVKSYAGCGKSSTIVKFCEARPNSKILIIVYNNGMYLETKHKFKHLNDSDIHIATFHRLAIRNITDSHKMRLKEKELDVSDLLIFLPTELCDDPKNKYLYGKALLGLVNNFTSSSHRINDFISYIKRNNAQYSKKYNIPILTIIDLFEDVWNDILSSSSLGYLHDIYLKLYQLSKPFLNYDYIIIDEGQDINPVMIDIVLTQKETSKLLFVGDDLQSIYSWRGAINSLGYLTKHFKTDIMYLTKSFRCPPKIGFYANSIFAKSGGEHKEFVCKGNIQAKDKPSKKTYIARTNAYLFDYCAQNIDKKIFFVGGFKSYMFDDIMDLMKIQIKKKEWLKNKFLARFDSLKEVMEYAHATKDIGLISSVGIIFKYSKDKQNIFDVIQKIKECSTKKEKDCDFRIVTAHKSKGLEWNHVELLSDFPIGKKGWKKKDINFQEELNLLYVSITRTQCSIDLPEYILDYISSNED